MNIRLSEGGIRLRLSGLEAETLVQRKELTITLPWVTGPALPVRIVLNAEGEGPRVRGEGSGLLVMVPYPDFKDLLEQQGRRDAGISWTESAHDKGTVAWTLDIDAFPARSRAPRRSGRLESTNLL